MVTLGYALSSEEFDPRQLVSLAKRAEETGFTFALISDHFHPWLDTQGQSPFVWSTLGGIAMVTERLAIGTGVTCPLIRTHPVIVAHAAATAADMLNGRFFLGLGTGEYLNEHITGAHWPVLETRQEMLREAVDVIRTLWQGGYFNHRGPFYTVEQARLYTLPENPPPVYIAASGPKSARLAGELADGLISTAPDQEVVSEFDGFGGSRPKFGQLTVCWAEDENEAKETARHYWANSGIPGQLSQELASPAYFGSVASIVTTDEIAKTVVCGPDPEKYRAEIEKFAKAGFTHVYLHQIGQDQEGFFAFARRELLPAYPEQFDLGLLAKRYEATARIAS
jgi:G6PDH family F420-dependent oxidoreductase